MTAEITEERGMAAPAIPRDGRAARSQRTRRLIVDALTGLVGDGDPRPNAAAIAARAGISERSVFAHFASLEDLYRTAGDRITEVVIGMLWPIAPGLALLERIDALCRQRAQINEEVGPMRRAAALQEPFSAALAAQREFARRSSLEQIRRVFAAELAGLDDAGRVRRVASVDAAISGEAWDLMRSTHGLSRVEAQTAMAEAVRQLLSAYDPITPNVPTPAGTDDRIGRLVKAIEAGAPADLLAPRLRELADRRRSDSR
jgi:TetR/AcrR family transcriptional regulator of autoinduction and epiphytic fitness